MGWIGLILLIASFWFFGFWPTIFITIVLLGVTLIFKVCNVISSTETALEDYNNSQLRFVYCDANGEVTTRKLTQWTESTDYVEGFCLTRRDVRTFRKDRIVSFLDGTDSLLSFPKRRPRSRYTVRNPSDQRPQILFTGFSSAKRAELESIANSAELHVVQSVTKSLSYLCVGPNAGPAKIEKAQWQQVYILNEEQFHHLLETGELIET